MSIQRLLDAIERRGDIGRRVAALVLPISYRPRVTSSCAGKIGLREPGEHTGGPNLASRDNVAHNPPLYIRFWKRRHRSLQRQSIALLSLPGCPCPAGPLVPLAASNKISALPASSLRANTCRVSCIYPCGCDRGMMFLRKPPWQSPWRIDCASDDECGLFWHAEIRAVKADTEEFEEALYRRVAETLWFQSRTLPPSNRG